jgi:putative phosphoribosyl transferase
VATHVAEAVQITDGSNVLNGDLHVPERCEGLVIFAHGSGSGRFSPRNRQVAQALEDAGFGTLLMDLLTNAEEIVDRRTAEFRFGIDRLGRRVVAAADWSAAQPALRDLNIGYFGASTGAAAALIAAAARPERPPSFREAAGPTSPVRRCRWCVHPRC